MVSPLLKGTQREDRKTASRKDGAGGVEERPRGGKTLERERARGGEEAGVQAGCTRDLAVGLGGLCQVGTRQEGCWWPREKHATKNA